MVVVGLVVLGPLEASLDSVEEAGLSGLVLVLPLIALLVQHHLHTSNLHLELSSEAHIKR